MKSKTVMKGEAQMASGLKNFLVTFAAATLLFAVIGGLLTGYISGTITKIINGDNDNSIDIVGDSGESEDDDKDKDKSNDQTQLPDGTSFTIAVIGTDFYPDLYDDYYYNTEYLDKISSKVKMDADSIGLLTTTNLRYVRATWITLVHADREGRKYVACYFSPETEVNASFGITTLGDIYGIYGIDALCEYLTVMTGMDINYRFIIDGVNEKAFLEGMGSVTFNLSGDLYSADECTVSSSSSEAGYGRIPETTSPLDTYEREETKADNKNNKNDGSKPVTVKPETSEATSEDNGKSKDPILTAGEQSLTDYSIRAINTLREYSASDIELKSGCILTMLKQYLERCADWSAEDFSWKIGDLAGGEAYGFESPYDTKPTLATDLTTDASLTIHPMINAVRTFAYESVTCPGYFSDNDFRFIPDTAALGELFSEFASSGN